MTPTCVHVKAVPCSDCSESVLSGHLLVAQPGPVLYRPRHAAPLALEVALVEEPEPDLVLHLGHTILGHALVVLLGTKQSDSLIGLVRPPHFHRLHVCPTVPAGWSAEQVLTAAGAATAVG